MYLTYFIRYSSHYYKHITHTSFRNIVALSDGKYRAYILRKAAVTVVTGLHHFRLFFTLTFD